jgi:hypothetical protein
MAKDAYLAYPLFLFVLLSSAGASRYLSISFRLLSTLSIYDLGDVFAPLGPSVRGTLEPHS